MENNNYDYSIEHFGVKGMKWGVRRPLTSSGHIVGSKYAKKGASAVKRGAKALASETKKAGQSLARGSKNIIKSELEERKARKTRGPKLEKKLKNFNKVKKMSEEEIKQYTQRLQLENNLKRLATSTNDKEGLKVYKWRELADDDKIREINTRLQMEENLRQQLSKARAYNQSQLGKSVMNIAGNTAVDVLKAKSKAPKGTKVLSSDVVFDALKANAKKETYDINKKRNKNSPSYKKSFDELKTDIMWQNIDKMTPKKETTAKKETATKKKKEKAS